MNITVKRLDELRRPEKNIRLHTSKQIDEYIRSLEMFGQIRPIVVDEDGEIIAGNGMYLAMEKMGKETCECYVVSGLSEAQKKKLMLADNKVFELGVTDTDAFEDILKELGADFDIPGYDSSMLEMLSMSFAEADAFISSYGNFGEDDVTRITEKPAETHVEGVPTGSPEQARPAPMLNTAPEQKASGDAGNSQETTQVNRFIICPKCGERICL